MKYYNDSKMYGKIIEWNKLINKLWKLGVYSKGLENIWYPHHNINKNIYNVIVSERSIGKTTNILLLGMLANVEYGTIMHYIREDTRQVVQSKISNIFNTIINLGYVDIITSGKWNTIIYKQYEKKFYYAKLEDNKIVEVCSDYLMYVMSIDQSEQYKSSYTCNDADMIIFDEFISKSFYKQNNFCLFLDIVKTLQRERLSPRIFMLSNTIDKNSEYFDELECRDFIDICNIGDKIEYTTNKGTPIYVEIAKVNHSENKRKLNTLFYGFKNNKLASITGEAWAVSDYQHIKFKQSEILLNNIYVEIGKMYLKLDVCNTELGIVVCVHYAHKPKYEDSIIYSMSDYDDTRKQFLTGDKSFPLNDFIWNKMFKNNRFYFQNNNVGAKIDYYYNSCRKYFYNKF